MVDNLSSFPLNASDAPETSSAPWVAQYSTPTGHAVNPPYTQELGNNTFGPIIPGLMQTTLMVAPPQLVALQQTYMTTPGLDPIAASIEPTYLASSKQTLLPAEVNCTTALFGNRVAQARNVKYEEKDALLFVFGVRVFPLSPEIR
jgi:hypothetical protein